MARLYSSFLGSITHKAEAMVTPRRKCRRPAIRLNPIHIPNQNTLSLRVGLKAAGRRRTAPGRPVRPQDGRRTPRDGYFICGGRFAGEGASTESGVIVNGDFRFFCMLYIANLHIQGY